MVMMKSDQRPSTLYLNPGEKVTLGEGGNRPPCTILETFYESVFPNKN